MKVILVMFAFISASCTYELYDSFIPQEFEFPDEKLGSGKTFIYQNPVTKEEVYKDITLVNKDGKNYRSSKSYDRKSISDSLIIFNGETVEAYNFFMSGDGRVVQGVKLQDVIKKNSDKLDVHAVVWKYLTGQLSYTTTIQEKYMKDTVITWKDKDLPCLVVNTDGNIRIQEIGDSSANHNIVLFSKFYYGKSIGLIKYSIDFTDHNGMHNSNSWELKDIKNIN